jgi:GNAT superfamily N-acetyltransferase
MHSIAVRAGEDRAFEAFLSDRIYEYNAAATGYRDAECFSAALRGAGGVIEAGVYGYTWGGCCHVAYLWVAQARRRRGLGSRLLDAVERHAAARGCRRVLLSSHSFQAPEFYRLRGYVQSAVVHDHPPGHSSFHFAKQLPANQGSGSCGRGPALG